MDMGDCHFKYEGMDLFLYYVSNGFLCRLDRFFWESGGCFGDRSLDGWLWLVIPLLVDLISGVFPI